MATKAAIQAIAKGLLLFMVAVVVGRAARAAHMAKILTLVVKKTTRGNIVVRAVLTAAAAAGRERLVAGATVGLAGSDLFGVMVQTEHLGVSRLPTALKNQP